MNIIDVNIKAIAHKCLSVEEFQNRTAINPAELNVVDPPTQFILIVLFDNDIVGARNACSFLCNNYHLFDLETSAILKIHFFSCKH